MYTPDPDQKLDRRNVGLNHVLVTTRRSKEGKDKIGTAASTLQHKYRRRQSCETGCCKQKSRGMRNARAPVYFIDTS